MDKKYLVVHKAGIVEFCTLDYAIKSLLGWESMAVVWYDEIYDRWYIVNGVDAT